MTEHGEQAAPTAPPGLGATSSHGLTEGDRVQSANSSYLAECTGCRCRFWNPRGTGTYCMECLHAAMNKAEILLSTATDNLEEYRMGVGDALRSLDRDDQNIDAALLALGGIQDIPTRCPECGGKGSLPPCSTCKTTAHVSRCVHCNNYREVVSNEGDRNPHWVPCPECSSQRCRPTPLIDISKAGVQASNPSDEQLHRDIIRDLWHGVASRVWGRS